MLNRITNREDPDNTESNLGLHCLPRPSHQATSVQNVRTFTVLLGRMDNSAHPDQMASSWFS